MKKYVKGLDGLRAIAIMAVLLYHLGFKIPGGFLGVDLFFVISGFIIMTISLQNKNFEILRFYKKRLIRLYPALIFSLMFTIFLTFLTHKELNLRRDIFFSLIYLENYALLLFKIDYFEQYTLITPLKHLWSLAIEAQFYLIFPIIFYFFKHKLRKLFLGLFIISIISLLLMIFNFRSINFVYYSTQTRIFELIIGVLIAIIYYKHHHNFKKMIFLSNVITICSLSIFLFLLFNLNSYSNFLYFGGFYLICLICGLLILFINTNTILTNILESKIFVFIGKRSYSLYLFHYPIIVLLIKPNQIGKQSFFMSLFLLFFIFLTSCFSYFYVENIKNLKKFKKSILFLIIISFLILLFPSNYKPLKNDDFSLIKFNNHLENPNIFSNDVKKEFERFKKMENDLKNSSFLIYGDSLSLNIEDEFKKTFQNTVVDGLVGRQVYNAEFNNTNHFDNVIIIMGSNGNFSLDDYRNLLTHFKNSNIYIINVKMDRPWESEVNNDLNVIKNEFKDVSLVNWYEESLNHPEYFEEDSVHLTITGQVAYVNLLKDVILVSVK